MHKALVVDDHPVIRMAVKMLLERERYEVVGEADNGLDAVQMARELEPDLVVLDIGIPKLDGLEVIPRMRALQKPPKILVLTSRPPSFFSNRCMQSGASGYVYKVEDLNELQNAIRAVMSGYNYFPCLPFSSVRASDNVSETDLLNSLSDKEMLVFLKLAQGYANKDIADELLLSSKTISTYKARLMEKLRVNNQVELSELARRHSLL